MYTRPIRTVLVSLLISLAGGLVVPLPVEGQIVRRLRDVAKSAAEDELARRIDHLVRSAVRCATGDMDCWKDARADGKDVIFTDEQGEIIKDDKGVPITDPEKAAKQAGVDLNAPQRPGEGVWANYDFVPGDQVLFYEDFTNDRVGAFPRRMEFVAGNWEVVEWQGRRLLRSTGPRAAALKIILPKALPERFTIEFEVYIGYGNGVIAMATTPPSGVKNATGIKGNYFQIYRNATGVNSRDRSEPTSLNPAEIVNDRLTPVRIHVDGEYARVYVGERRVANIPNAQLARSEELWIEDADGAAADRPIYIGPIRIAEGGGDLYDRLVEDGRVITQGILFAVNSATLRPESTPTLNEIGEMLAKHTSLRLLIEGHTDSTGTADGNLTLSQQRAEAVRAYLVERLQIDQARLEARGLGQTRPIGDNASSEGRQNNRRVELVRLE